MHHQKSFNGEEPRRLKFSLVAHKLQCADYAYTGSPIMIFLFKHFSSIKDNSIFVVKRISHFEARAILTRNGMDATCFNE